MTISYFASAARDIMQVIARIRICAVVLVLTGCAGTPKYLRWYEGPALESNKVAVLQIHQDPWHYAAMVDLIDGAPIRKSKGAEFNNTETIELLPGKHQLQISYMGTDGYSISPAILSFTTEEGHLYELFAAPKRSASAEGLGAIFFGRRYYWTAWIIDSGTKEVVAGEKWENPPQHYEDSPSPKGAASNLRP